MRPLVYISHAPEDDKLLHELVTHLAPLRRTSIRIWHKGRIGPGRDVRSESEDQLRAAQVVVLFLSPDFLANDEIYKHEMSLALDSGALVIPLLARPCVWQATPLAGLRMVPRSKTPIDTHKKRDAAWLQVVMELHEAIEGLDGAPNSHWTTDVRRPAVPVYRSSAGWESVEVAPAAPEQDVSVWCEPITGMRFVSVPPGSFWMGSSLEHDQRGYDPDAQPAEMPVHEVELPHGMWMGEHPVTNAQYKRFLDESGHPEPALWQDPRFNAPEQPVVGVSFADALEFCAWLDESARLHDGLCFDLPTEAEWEYAARGPGGLRYPWGDADPTGERACFDLPEWSGGTAPVGGRPQGRSPFGCQDMSGNVWEWCLDGWRDRYEEKNVRAVNPCHAGDAHTSARVIRGGSWRSPASWIGCARRQERDPRVHGSTLGFRVVIRGSRQPWRTGF